MPPACLPNKWSRKIAQWKTLASYQEQLTKRYPSCNPPKATVGIWILLL